MSISMNDHETRIRVLEGIKSGLKLKLIASKVMVPGSWKDVCDINNYSDFIIWCGFGASIERHKGITIDDVHFVNRQMILDASNVVNNFVVGSDAEWLEFSIEGDVLKCRSYENGAGADNNYVYVWALNLYYKLRDLLREVF